MDYRQKIERQGMTLLPRPIEKDAVKRFLKKFDAGKLEQKTLREAWLVFKKKHYQTWAKRFLFHRGMGTKTPVPYLMGSWTDEYVQIDQPYNLRMKIFNYETVETAIYNICVSQILRFIPFKDLDYENQTFVVYDYPEPEIDSKQWLEDQFLLTQTDKKLLKRQLKAMTREQILNL